MAGYMVAAGISSKMQSLIPPLTADSQKGYTVSYTPKGDNPAWYAVSGEISTTDPPEKYITSSTNKALTYYVTFPKPTEVEFVVVFYCNVGNATGAYQCKSFSGQEEGGNWSTIPLVSKSSSPIIPKSPPKYKSYRIVLDYLGGYGVGVSQIMFFGK